jgi:hypothetical protein
MVPHHPFPSSASAGGSWQAILDGALREQALETVRTIAASLGSMRLEVASLDSGAAGLAVCFAYLAEGLADPGHEVAARRFLDQALGMAEAAPMLPWLCDGLAGIGWAASHLCRRLHWPDLEESLAEIDERVCACLEQPVWQEDYDLSGGLVGLGVYTLERLAPGADSTRLTAPMGLERVVEHLLATADRQPGGATWWRGPERMWLHARKKMPDGAYDLGMAAGVAGVIAFLARACAAGGVADQARPLLDEAVRWLLAQEAPDGPPEGFPYAIRPGAPQQNWTRSSWVYGDPGVAVALLGAARWAGVPAWEERALAAALRATSRPPDRTRIVDAGLLIGAAGLAHLLNRLYQATGERRLLERSRFWFERVLAMHRPGHGIGGFASWAPDDNDVERWWDDPGLLAGAAGIALALLSAATPLEPSWDRMMLVDLAPVARKAEQVP